MTMASNNENKGPYGDYDWPEDIYKEMRDMVVSETMQTLQIRIMCQAMPQKLP